jgi:HAD superfamily hydrolase (TIGR01509 family)
MCSWGSQEPDFLHIRARKNELYLSKIHLIEPNTKLIELALALLPHVSIVTSSNRIAVEGILSAFNLTEFFVNIVSSDDVSKTKPDPEPYLKSISKYPDSIHIAVEDSEFGIISAKAAGLLVLKTTDVLENL